MALRFLLRFPAFSQKEQNGPSFTFPWRFQTFLTALPKRPRGKEHNNSSTPTSPENFNTCRWPAGRPAFPALFFLARGGALVHIHLVVPSWRPPVTSARASPLRRFSPSARGARVDRRKALACHRPPFNKRLSPLIESAMVDQTHKALRCRRAVHCSASSRRVVDDGERRRATRSPRHHLITSARMTRRWLTSAEMIEVVVRCGGRGCSVRPTSGRRAFTTPGGG